MVMEIYGMAHHWVPSPPGVIMAGFGALGSGFALAQVHADPSPNTFWAVATGSAVGLIGLGSQVCAYGISTLVRRIATLEKEAEVAREVRIRLLQENESLKVKFTRVSVELETITVDTKSQTPKKAPPPDAPAAHAPDPLPVPPSVSPVNDVEHPEGERVHGEVFHGDR